ncbi:MAG: class I SAM-dependent methyltransferase [Lachnospiraceae bacterium]|nr:class I SAM-dependent methyltransferase [Lachnospiraceae bacterium]
MQEQIGKIILDKKYYPGVDLYCDGTIEDEILDIVQKTEPENYRKVIEERASWPIFYHLSPLRENIVEWLPIDKGAKVLEVGSGCGAITGALARKAGSVTCIDLSRKRSMINAYRHQDMENIYIHVGNFKDVEKDLECDYDYVMLIGVFEYGQGYMGSETPYEDFMNILKKHLKPGGRMVIAIENKLGLKYFAGCREDHSGRYFDGIEDYPAGSGTARTFTRDGLERIMKNCGVEEYSFYYPYPDYKFPTTIFSDRKLPKVGELYQNIRNFDRDRVLLFDEQKAYDMMIREGVFDRYANSYLVVIGPELQTEYAKYSNDRSPKFAIRTDIVKDNEGYLVKKYGLGEESAEHINNMVKMSAELTKAYEGTGLAINRCRQEDALYFEFLEGVTLEEILDECLIRNQKDTFLALVNRYRKMIQKGAEADVADYDLIFQNIMVSDDKWTVIDYEWTFERKISADIMFRRALYCYFADRKNREKAKAWISEFYKDEALFEGELWEKVVKAEPEFQRYVQGDYMAVSEIRHAIGNPVYSLDYLLDAVGAKNDGIQIYEDYGKGFSEAQSYRTHNIRRVGNIYEFDIKLNQDLTNIRIDPCDRPCIVTVESVLFGDENITGILAGRGRNGFRAHNGIRLSDISFFFPDCDPHFQWKVAEYAKKENAFLRVKLKMEYLSQETAQQLYAGFGLKGKLGSGR